MRIHFYSLLLVLALSGISSAQTTPAPVDTASATPGAVGSGADSSAPVAPAPDVPVVPPHKTDLSPYEARKIAQQYELREQELIFKANRAVADGRKAELGGDYIKANVYYATAAEAYGTGPQSALSYRRAADGLTRVNLVLYKDALDKGDEKRAKSLLDEALKYDPSNPSLLAENAKLTAALANPNSTGMLGNPAINPQFVKSVNDVQKYFSEAEQFRRTGQWDEAIDRLNKILGIDPYNIAATRFIQRINKEKDLYAERARLEGRDEALRHLEELWYNPVRNPEISTVPQDNQGPITSSDTDTFAIDQKLKTILLTMDFNDFTIDQALNYLSSESKRLDTDPDHKGVSFVIQPTVEATAKKITLNLDVPLPMGDALRYICAIAGVKYKVEEAYVLIVPYSTGPLDLVKRTFLVPQSFFAAAGTTNTDQGLLGTVGGGADAGGGGAPTRPTFVLPGSTPDSTAAQGVPQTIQQSLESKGIVFPAGASAVYSSTTQQLEVTNTPDQMELLEELVQGAISPVYMVRVSTKFVEINQQDLDDFTVNTVFNGFTNGISNMFNGTSFPVQGNGHPLNTPSFGTSLPGAAALPQNGIDNLLTGTGAPTENQFQIRGFLGASELNFILQALSQKRSYDLLSDPSTLVKSSEGATMEATRIFPYPTTFEPPQTVTPQANNGAANGVVTVQPPALPAVIPTTPTEFKQRLIGVRLVARPQIAPNNQDVDLTLLPEVTDFIGFVNYGSPIYIVDENGNRALMSLNQINQPVFNVRTINTHVLIHDGSTLVLGGLIREDVQSIDDRVPLLGDLPLLGRLFRSKAERRTKRNLIVFVTSTIYRNDGERLNAPDQIDAADVLTGRATVSSAPH